TYIKAEVSMMREIVQALKQEPAYRKQTRRILRIERRYLTTVKHQSEKQGLRRLTAKLLLVAASDNAKSFRTVTIRFNRLGQLGFTDLVSEMYACLEYGWCCKRFGKPEVGLRLLQGIRDKLLAAAPKCSTTAMRSYLKMVERDLKELEKSISA